MASTGPAWFTIGEEATPQIMQRIGAAVSAVDMSLQVRSAPTLAFWFIVDTLLLANQANREGMHANALSLTRQCVEAMSIVELGLCGHVEAEAILLKWDRDELTAGKLRGWLEANIWARHGVGLWNEPWSTFMGEFARAIQPYAHYGRSLAQWQLRLHGVQNLQAPDDDLAGHAVIEITPRAYDVQKADRITLFHMLLHYVLGRIWQSAHPEDAHFTALMERLGSALAKSRYLDGHETAWSQQFWAMLWMRGGGTMLE